MTVTANGSALAELERLLDARPVRDEELVRWRRDLRDALASLRGLVATTPVDPPDWMAARGSTLLRQRSVLLGRLARSRSLARGDPDLDRFTCEVRRLVADIRRHVQHAHDLVYDGVEQELGGSE